MTAHAMKGDKEYCLQIGFDGYVAKPVSLEVLHEEISRVMALPLNNAATLAQQLGLDATLLRELLVLFSHSLTEIEALLLRALDDADWPQISRLCHKLRGEAAIFDFASLTQLLQSTEARIRQHDIPDVTQLRATPGTLSFWIINDLPQSFNAITLHWRVEQQGRLLASGTRQVAAPADSGNKILDAIVTPADATPLQVKSQLTDADGKTLAENQLSLEVAPAAR